MVQNLLQTGASFLLKRGDSFTAEWWSYYKVVQFYNKMVQVLQIALHKKWSFLLRISSVNATKSAVSCGFGHIYWRNPYRKYKSIYDESIIYLSQISSLRSNSKTFFVRYIWLLHLWLVFKTPKKSAIFDHMLLDRHEASFDNFSILLKESKHLNYKWKNRY